MSKRSAKELDTSEKVEEDHPSRDKRQKIMPNDNTGSTQELYKLLDDLVRNYPTSTGSDAIKKNWMLDFAMLWPTSCADDELIAKCRNHHNDSFRWIRKEDLPMLVSEMASSSSSSSSSKQIATTNTVAATPVKKEPSFGVNIMSLVPDRYKKKKIEPPPPVIEIPELSVEEHYEIKKTILEWLNQKYGKAYVLFCKEIGTGTRFYTASLSDTFARTLISDLKKKGVKRNDGGEWSQRPEPLWVDFDKNHAYHEHLDKKSKCRCFMDFDVKVEDARATSNMTLSLAFEKRVSEAVKSLVRFVKKDLLTVIVKNAPTASQNTIGSTPSLITSVWDATNAKKISKHVIFRTNEDSLMFEATYDVGLYISKCTMGWMLSEMRALYTSQNDEEKKERIYVLNTVSKGIDFGMYEKSGEFRLPLCTKSGPPRHLKPESYEVTIIVDPDFKVDKGGEFYHKTTLNVKHLPAQGKKTVTVTRRFDGPGDRIFLTLQDSVKDEKEDEDDAFFASLLSKDPLSPTAIAPTILLEDTLVDSQFENTASGGDMVLLCVRDRCTDALQRRTGLRASRFSEFVHLEDYLSDSMVAPTVKYDERRILTSDGTALMQVGRNDFDDYFEKVDMLQRVISDDISDNHYGDTLSSLDMLKNVRTKSKKFTNSSDYVDTLCEFARMFMESSKNVDRGGGLSVGGIKTQLHPSLQAFEPSDSWSTSAFSGTAVQSSAILQQICERSDFKVWLLEHLDKIDVRFSGFLKNVFAVYDPMTIQHTLKSLIVQEIYAHISNYASGITETSIDMFREIAGFEDTTHVGEQPNTNTEADITATIPRNRSELLLRIYKKSLENGYIDPIDKSAKDNVIRLSDDREFTCRMFFKVKRFKYCPVKQTRCCMAEHSSNNSFIVVDMVRKRYRISCDNAACKEWLREHYDAYKKMKENHNASDTSRNKGILREKASIENDEEYIQNNVYFNMCNKTADMANVYVRLCESIYKLKQHYDELAKSNEQ